MDKYVWKQSSFIEELDLLLMSAYLSVASGLPLRHYSIEAQG
ncbi:hypothetical protein LINGRAPRIM_LOCUS2528 [Linum grandiflorum]